jgi:GNAT superfamily N-acetyltransferase
VSTPYARVTIRRGTPADARPAADLYLRAREAAVEMIPHPPAHTDDEVRAWFATHVVRECELWLAEGESGGLAGILVLDGPWVDQLYVEPTLTGRGVGTELLAFAKRERPQGLSLWTFVTNTGAQRFYERHGFAEAERTDGSRNEECAPDIRYVWDGAR